MKVVVTGGAGFIGSHLVERLVSDGFEVTVLDNLSSGSLDNLDRVRGKIELVVGDVKDLKTCLSALKEAEVVYHFAANPEVRVSSTEPRIHFEENVRGTFNVAEASRILGTVKTVVFASSSTVYGDASAIPTSEEHTLRPISVYGASKAAAELILHSYSALYGLKVVVARYANIVGPRMRHGVVYDFLMKLSRESSVLEVLGDGRQRKSYLYVDDAVEATLLAVAKSSAAFSVLNVGNEDWIEVSEIARIVSEVLGVRPRVVFSGGTPDGRGWPGDVKLMLLSIDKIKSLGWRPRYTSAEAIRLTAQALARELGLLPR
ncbi:MAG: NAD-dependent epimerase/dehydratase family protein [Sulfolobales archaeon]|nr:NAD-dependent epimerase/dehydratase family protein [Sulfolobales archaeon]MCX8208557.1 NAD-dependent epimerase/dehydratase family protein [Sulfolobales archaeon]MDW8010171.1 NAD-dependent epimerase/dehydratase family protein [Sulfolobales archaeon]